MTQPAPDTLTVWQVNVAGDWRYAEPDTAAMVAVLRPHDPEQGGTVRLVDVPVNGAVRFSRRPRRWLTHPPTITGRRLAAAERALKAQRDKAPLFAEQILAEQPTARERLEKLDGRMIESEIRERQDDARTWRKVRRWLRATPPQVRVWIVYKWNAGMYPGDPGYFLAYVHGRLRDAGYGHVAQKV